MADNFDPYHKWLGIPPRDQPPNHYRLLGIEPLESDEDVIEAAANRLMAFLQDMATGEHLEHSQAILDAIAEARLCLLTADDKAKYDQALRQKLAPPQAANIPTALPVASPATATPTPPPAPAAPPVVTTACPACTAPRARADATCDQCGFTPAPTVAAPTVAAPTVAAPATPPARTPLATTPAAPPVLDAEPPAANDTPEKTPPSVKRQRLVLIILGASACTVLAVLVGAMAMLPSTNPSAPATASHVSPPIAPSRPDTASESSPTAFRGRLNVRIAAEHRAEASGWVDDVPLEIPPQGACSLALEPGTHVVRIERPGYPPFEQEIEIRLGHPNLVIPTWQTAETTPPPDAPKTPNASDTNNKPKKKNKAGSRGKQRTPPANKGKPQNPPPAKPNGTPNKKKPPAAYRPWFVASAVELPAVRGEPVTLGEVRLSASDQLEMRLIGGDVVLGDERRFLLSRHPSQNTTFTVNLTQNDSDPTTVASFTLAGQALQFRWELDDLRTAAILRNCKLVLTSQEATGNHKQRVLALRKPQTRKPFALLGTFGKSEDRLEVSNRPDLSAVEMVVTGLQVAGDKSLLKAVRLQPGAEPSQAVPLPAKHFKFPLRFRLELSSSLRLQSKAQAGERFVTQRNINQLVNTAFGPQLQKHQQRLAGVTDPNSAEAKAVSTEGQRLQTEMSKVSADLRQGTERFRLHFDLLCHLNANHHVVLLTTRPAVDKQAANEGWVQPPEIQVTSAQGQFESTDEQAFRIHDFGGPAATYAVAFRPGFQRFSGIRIEALVDDLKPGPGLGKGGQAVLNRVTLSHADQPLTLSEPWSNSQHKRREWGEAATLQNDPNDRHGWKIDGKDIGQNMFIAYRVTYPDDMRLDRYAPYQLHLHFHGDEAPPFGCIRVCLTAAKQPHLLP